MTVAKGAVAAAVVAAVVTPWLWMVTRRAPDFLRTSLGHEVVTRMAQPLEGHKGPPGYHLATIWPFFLPWSLLLPLAVVLAWKRRRLLVLRFSLAAVLGPWVMFELVRTKLPHYMLPTYPWLALLVADAVVRCLRGQHRDLTGKAFLAAVTTVTAVMALGALVPAAGSWWFGEGLTAGMLLAAAAVAYLGVVVALLYRRRTAAALATLGAGAMAVWAMAWVVYLPGAQYLRVSVRTADVLRRHGATGPGQVLMLDYKEPSLAFYQGGAVREDPSMRLTEKHVEAGTPWYVITSAVWNNSDPQVRDRFEVVGRVGGVAYAAGRKVDVLVVKAPPKAATTQPGAQ